MRLLMSSCNDSKIQVVGYKVHVETLKAVILSTTHHYKP